VFIAVIILVLLGNTLFLSNIKQNLNNTETELKKQNETLELIEKSIEEIDKNNQKLYGHTVLNKGEEGQLMSCFINEILEKKFIVKKYDLYSKYVCKPDNTDEKMENLNSETNQQQVQKKFASENNTSDQNKNNSESIPLLDENGMPIDAYKEKDSEEWEGLNIIPIAMQFEMSHNNKLLNILLLYIQDCYSNTIRSADFVFKNGKISGNLVLAFPINDN
jgi:hypothetical protein